jgi:replicative DNA helicase
MSEPLEDIRALVGDFTVPDPASNGATTADDRHVFDLYGTPIGFGDGRFFVLSPNGTHARDAVKGIDGDGEEKPVIRFRLGGSWVLDGPPGTPAVWGRGDQVLWAKGQPFLPVGPAGVGKTTLVVQLVGGLLGLIPSGELLGFPVEPIEGRVLYLALDRPAQIRQAAARYFSEEHRSVLDERLVIWHGPLPRDLGKRPETLLEVCRLAEAAVVIIDSLKDTTAKLADDEFGSNVNRAMQFCVAEGIEVAAPHHQRKGQDGRKPKTLEDVYGSTWLTAGAGSVVLLWGAAGDPLVELSHLKPAASEVGPLMVEHDHLTGRSTVYRGAVDALTVLRNSPSGLTATDLARLIFEKTDPTDVQRKKADRQLQRLVSSGKARHDPRDRSAGVGSGVTARFYAIEDRAEEPA